jgi:integrase
MDALSWGADLTAWGNYLRASGAPATTIGQRTYHLTRLAGDFPDGHRSVTFDALTVWLASHDWAPNTRRAYRASLRAYWSWLLATGRCSDSPAHLLPPVRIPRGLPRPAPEAAYRLALGVADDRARLEILLGGACGLRRGEIARSRREDMERDLTGWALRVTGKGGHIRLVPLPDELVAEIGTRPPGWLFPSSHGGHLTPHHLGKIVSRHLPGDLTTHALRHRCGTVAYAATRDLRAVQELLGHAKPETTALYTLVPGESVRAAMQAASS